ncbi:MAG TPA: DNA double-strand break repair nuclease NurA [Allocoleopsis sp.]
MALKSAQVLALLQAKQADFKTFDQTALNALQKYRAALVEASQKTATELERLLAKIRNSGASPLEALGTSPNWVITSNLVWQNREQSLSWVRDRLIGIATFAVDGSQIFPTKDFSIPVALVQIGWFENLHLPSGTYEKDVALDVMTPTDLKVSHSGEPVDRRVNMRRFEMETQRLIQYMQEHKNCNDCLVFFDGSLIATFAEAFDPDTRAFYVDCLLELLQTSEDYRVPLVAYIDTSYARDLTVMLQQGFKLPEVNAIHDAQLLSKFMSWGDRTPLFLCQRSGILGQYQDHANKIAFTYLKTTHDGYPARLEMPVWMHEAGIVDRVLDWVRGEVVIGNGYPYVIETADQTAVLQAEDRHTFYRIFQDWAEKEELNLRLSRKMVSKARRR